MPYRTEILTAARLGLVTGSGHLTGREITEACASMVTDVRWEPTFDEIWDFTGAEVDVTPDELDALVESVHVYADRIAGGRCVFVTARESVQPLLRLFEWLTADLQRTYETVPTLEQAVAWLDRPVGALSLPALASRAASREEG